MSSQCTNLLARALILASSLVDAYAVHHSVHTPLVMSRHVAVAMGASGKGFGGGEATRDPAPTIYDPSDPKGKQQAIHKAESFADYLARRKVLLSPLPTSPFSRMHTRPSRCRHSIPSETRSLASCHRPKRWLTPLPRCQFAMVAPAPRSRFAPSAGAPDSASEELAPSPDVRGRPTRAYE